MASLFTRIIERELPAEIVYEDDHSIAILDINPKAEGHTLVMPKEEVADFHALPPEVLAGLMNAVQTVARGIMKAMDTPHYNLDLNNGAPAGQVVYHVHFHIIPRREGDGLGYRWPAGKLSNQRATELKNIIIQQF